MSLKPMHRKEKQPDLYGMGAVAKLIGKTSLTARTYARTLHGRGTMGVLRANNGDYYVTALGIEAIKLESVRPGRASLKPLHFVA